MKTQISGQLFLQWTNRSVASLNQQNETKESALFPTQGHSDAPNSCCVYTQNTVLDNLMIIWNIAYIYMGFVTSSKIGDRNQGINIPFATSPSASAGPVVFLQFCTRC